MIFPKPAVWAGPAGRAYRLQNAYLALLETLGTRLMRGFGRAFDQLKDIHANSGIHWLQFVAGFLLLPVFKLSDLAFEFTNIVQHRRMLLLSRNIASLRSDDLLIDLFDGVQQLRIDGCFDQRCRGLARRRQMIKRRLEGI